MQALVIGAAHQGKIDLLLTDVVMPIMRGPALAAQVLVQYPDIRDDAVRSALEGPRASA